MTDTVEVVVVVVIDGVIVELISTEVVASVLILEVREFVLVVVDDSVLDTVDMSEVMCSDVTIGVVMIELVVNVVDVTEKFELIPCDVDVSVPILVSDELVSLVTVVVDIVVDIYENNEVVSDDVDISIVVIISVVVKLFVVVGVVVLVKFVCTDPSWMMNRNTKTQKT